ncbi:hypothetical protein L218DRAFT_1075566 [Marasmius fiardii PR-910]|nr:hypothetical protein L218DRAFT_1075566 [Marasmius fiardii PR-910]
MTSPSSCPSPTTSTISDIDDFPDPPNLVSLSNAKLTLNEHLKSLEQLSSKINEAEAHLAQIVLEARCAINEMTREKSLIEEKVSRTQSYLAPIRRLPSELLSYVFNWCFQDHPCCAWILAAVCRKWRRLALNMPRIWSKVAWFFSSASLILLCDCENTLSHSSLYLGVSIMHPTFDIGFLNLKIRLLTTQHFSPDIIRLWLERSGPTVPLDIEIYLRVVKSSPDSSPNPRIRSRRSTSPTSPAALFYSTWSTHHQVLPGGVGSAVAGPPVAHYVIPHPSTALPPAHTPLIVPFASQPVTPIHDGWDPWVPSPPPSFAHASLSHRDRRNNKHDRSSVNGLRNGNHWGWIAMFYLVEQIHRWERFVFRFDKHFNSIAALKSINGDAPLLKEFEVSSAEPALYHDCSWLPNLNFLPSSSSGSSSQHAPSLPLLQSLTLQNAPFKWSSPMFHTDLHTLNLRALPTSHISLDRIFHILHANRDSLKCLSLHFQCVTQTVLPLNPLKLPDLTEFSVGGHHYLSQLVEILTMPMLEELNLDIDARDPIEDIIAGVVSRVTSTPVSSGGIKHLSVAYGYGCGRRATKDAQRLREKDGKSYKLSSGSDSNSPSSPTYPPTSAGSPSSSLYYGTGTIVSWAFLADMSQLESLRVGGTPMDTLLSALGAPDDDLLSGSAAAVGVAVPGGGSNSWLCPNLSELAMKYCHAHSEGVGKLVQFVDARNPDGGSGTMVVNGVAPTPLKSLELYECAVLGPDVLEWLKGRVEEVQVSELPYERTSLSPY